jgi:hypothetical protein
LVLILKIIPCPREQVWNKLSKDWKPDNLSDIATEITLNELSEKIDLMLNGKLKGRTVVNKL